MEVMQNVHGSSKERENFAETPAARDGSGVNGVTDVLVTQFSYRTRRAHAHAHTLPERE